MRPLALCLVSACQTQLQNLGTDSSPFPAQNLTPCGVSFPVYAIGSRKAFCDNEPHDLCALPLQQTVIMNMVTEYMLCGPQMLLCML